ncbi:MAG: B12-binding domain-containing radical SAM protein [Proteobacteria bacterium]|nr:B12-binding domain-containing radical SAM protein [Pseudomonadota bacterium]
MSGLPIRKIVFIEPCAPGAHIYKKWGLPRMGTLILATILRDAGFEVKVFFEDIKGIDYDDVFDADLVGISTITSTAPRAYEMANIVRKAGIPVVMGGPHVSFLVEEALEHCDFVMRGEAEETIIPFIRALETGEGFESIPGLSWRYGNRIRSNDLPERCQDLDRYPFPDFDLVGGSKKFKGDLSITPIIMSRGCPFGCNFCSVTAMFGRRYRFRSVGNVMEELRQRKPSWVFFYDDNFVANPSHTKELLRAMIAEGISMKWSAQVRIDVARDPELLGLMKRAGCTIVYIGLESINARTLEALNKGQTPEEMEKAIRIINSYGINIHGMFIFGADHDDPATLRETVKFAKRNGLASVQFMILVPLPGTQVFNNLAAEGRLISRDWAYYDAHHVVFTPKGMSVLQLQTLTIKSMVRFYSFRQVVSKLLRLDMWGVVMRMYGWRMTRKSRANMRGFIKHLREAYAQAGTDITNARNEIHLKARKTTDDLKDLVNRVNLDRIREIKQERLRRWRSQARA